MHSTSDHVCLPHRASRGVCHQLELILFMFCYISFVTLLCYDGLCETIVTHMMWFYLGLMEKIERDGSWDVKLLLHLVVFFIFVVHGAIPVSKVMVVLGVLAVGTHVFVDCKNCGSLRYSMSASVFGSGYALQRCCVRI